MDTTSVVLISLTTVAGLASAISLLGEFAGNVRRCVAGILGVVILGLGTAAGIMVATGESEFIPGSTVGHLQVDGLTLTVSAVARSPEGRARLFVEFKSDKKNVPIDVFKVESACALSVRGSVVGLDPSNPLIVDGFAAGTKYAGILTTRGVLPANVPGTLKCTGFPDVDLGVVSVYQEPDDSS
jgi:hypothetical protein